MDRVQPGSTNCSSHTFTLWSLLRFWLPSLLLLALTACGGGGGGSSDTGGGGSVGEFSLSTTSLTFEAGYRGNLPSDQTIQTSWSDPQIAGFAFVFTATDPKPDWLDISQTVSASPADMTFSINTTDLTPGTYNATLPLYSGDISAKPLVRHDITLTYNIHDQLTVSPPSLDFAYVIGLPSAPAGQTLNLDGERVSWTASSDATWVRPASSSGTGPGTLAVSVDPAGLTAGNYASVLTFTDTANNRKQAVTVNLTVSDPALVLDQSSLSFSGMNGIAIAGQTLSFAIGHGGVESWTASVDQSWLLLDRTSGNTPDTLQVSVDPALGSLASGSHSAMITITSSSGGQHLVASVPVSLTLTPPTLTLNPSKVTLGGSDGLDESSQSFSIALDTGANAYPWEAQIIGAPWLLADKTSGTASSSADTVVLDVDRSGFVGGTYNADIKVTATINGDLIEETLPVAFNLEAHKLFIPDNGVAFVSTPGIRRLSRSLSVTDTLGRITDWNAVSDQPWLSVTAGGVTGDDLALSADISGLATDQLYLANVTVSSSDATIENTETVRVGLWVGASDPNAMDVVATSDSEIVSDPIRPYVYAHTNGTYIEIYNVYTGALVGTVPNVGSMLGDMIISRDGGTLYVLDMYDDTLIPLDLDDYSKSTPWSIDRYDYATYLAFSRVKAQDFVYASNGFAYDTKANGTKTFSIFAGGNILYIPASSRDGDTLCGVSAISYVTRYILNCYRLDYSVLDGGKLQFNGSSIQGSTDIIGNDAGYDVAVSADGSRVYVASDASSGFIGYDFDGVTISRSQMLDALSYPSNLEISVDDRLYGGATKLHGDHSNLDDDVWVYDTVDGTQLYSNYVSGSGNIILARQLVVSGDGVRAMMLTSDHRLIFLTAP